MVSRCQHTKGREAAEQQVHPKNDFTHKFHERFQERFQEQLRIIHRIVLLTNSVILQRRALHAYYTPTFRLGAWGALAREAAASLVQILVPSFVEQNQTNAAWQSMPQHSLAEHKTSRTCHSIDEQNNTQHGAAEQHTTPTAAVRTYIRTYVRTTNTTIIIIASII